MQKKKEKKTPASLPYCSPLHSASARRPIYVWPVLSVLPDTVYATCLCTLGTIPSCRVNKIARESGARRVQPKIHRPTLIPVCFRGHFIAFREIIPKPVTCSPRRAISITGRVVWVVSRGTVVLAARLIANANLRGSGRGISETGDSINFAGIHSR